MKTTKENARDVVKSLFDLMDTDGNVYGAFADMLMEHAERTPGFRKALDAWLDEQLSNDAFGTEGQLDPRGDHRDEEDES